MTRLRANLQSMVIGSEAGRKPAGGEARRRGGATARSAHLTKSRFLAGLQCERRLWLEGHAPERATPPGPAQQAVFDEGHAVGRLAHGLFPGGVLVDEAPWEHAEAVRRTRVWMDDASVPAVFEAAFEHAGVRVRVDLLERLPAGAFGLREVKATSKVKEEHLPDLAVQLFVLRGAGLEVPSAELVHVDPDFVRGAGPPVPAALLARTEQLAAAEARVAAVLGEVERMHAVLARGEEPAVEPGRHCFRPHECPFWAHCTRAKPADWVLRLPRITEDAHATLRARGVERLGEIPADFPLSETQARVREAHRTGRPVVLPGLAAALAGAGPPALYLDFEATGPALPLYPGTRPYQAIPFQWSLHRASGAGGLAHREHLAKGDVDPRRKVAETLLAAVDELSADPEEPVLVYSGYERRILGDLAAALPDLAGPLEALRSRLFDLLPVVSRHVYHPAFAGSFSIKAVAPALVPGLSWEDLGEVAGGQVASAAFARLAAGEVPAAERTPLRDELLAYCRRDTEALAGLHAALRDLCALPATRPEEG